MRHSDFYNNLTIHPVKQDLAILEDIDSITNCVKNIVFTNKYERPFAPNRGAGIPDTLFDNMGPESEVLISNLIKEAIQADEPRATKVNVAVSVDLDRNGYQATIYYTPINTTTQIKVQTLLQRIR